jgi:protein-S-isoprenylcysteine O-methyltransferase Ste14
MNNSPTLIFTITYFIWCFSEILLSRLLRTKSTDKQHADNGTLSIIWITIIICIFLSVYISIAYNFQISEDLLIRYLGLAIIYIGIIFRMLVVKSLGKFFTVTVTIRQDHKLKKDGFYKYIRHPSYLASLLSFVGFGISLNNWISLLLLSSAILFVFILRIKVEEKVLIQEFGTEYSEYKKTTKGIVPFIY